MKNKRFLKIILLIVLAILLAAACIAGFVSSKLDLIQYSDGVRESITYDAESSEEQILDPNLELNDAAPVLSNEDIASSRNVTNILLIGTDERETEFSEAARADSMILVSINKKENTVKLVSLERGMGAPILEGPYAGAYDWLTHIFRYGGADLLCRTVEECLRVEIDHYVRLNFTSVIGVVDAIGGIDMELTALEAWHMNIGDIYDTMQEGMNHLNGAHALEYARIRAIDSDWKRIERQRKVILACVDSLKKANLLELNDLLNSFLPMIQTNMTKTDISEWILYAPKLLNAEFDQRTIPEAGTYGGMEGLGGKILFAVDFEVNAKILHDFLYGDGE